MSLRRDTPEARAWLNKPSEQMKRTEMKRGKALSPGKKKRASDKAKRYAKLMYYHLRGWLTSEGYMVAPCQLCGKDMFFEDCRAHHKTPRSELNKAGAEALDAPELLLAVHGWCHTEIHGQTESKGGDMGRPLQEAALDFFVKVESCEANCANGLRVEFKTI